MLLIELQAIKLINQKICDRANKSKPAREQKWTLVGIDPTTSSPIVRVSGALPLSYRVVLYVLHGIQPLELKFDFQENMNFILSSEKTFFDEKLYYVRFNQDSGREIQETVRWPSGLRR